MAAQKELTCYNCEVKNKYQQKVGNENRKELVTNSDEKAPFKPIYYNKNVEDIVKSKLETHLERCDPEVGTKMTKLRENKSKQTNTLEYAGTTPQTTTYRHIKDAKHWFRLDMGYAKFTTAANHLRAILDKPRNRWTERDLIDIQGKKAAMVDFIMGCLDKDLEARMASKGIHYNWVPRCSIDEIYKLLEAECFIPRSFLSIDGEIMKLKQSVASMRYKKQQVMT